MKRGYHRASGPLRTCTVTFRVPFDINEKLNEIARNRGISRTQVVEEIFDPAFEKVIKNEKIDQ
jgi:predicted transcriptional regulator